MSFDQGTHSFARRLAAVAVALTVALPTAAVPTVAAVSGVVPHRVTVNPARTLTSETAASHFACQDRAIGAGRCYSPQQIQKAYGFDKVYGAGLSGRGKTIVIIDAFSNPYVQSDLSIFDATFGLPDPVFQIVAMPGVPAFDWNDPNQTGWAGEITLDVQWSHAIAPGAKIVLVEAASNNDADILTATKYAINHRLGDVISQSFGEGEICMDPKLLRQQHELFEKATRMGITLLASSGDQGAAQPACDGSDSYFKSASTPASDPNVTGVGGTTLGAAADGTYQFEYAWSEGVDIGIPCLTANNDGCSGGGFSVVYGRPDYQRDLIGRKGMRGVPDVAYNAGVDGGVLTHDGVDLQLIGQNPTDPALFFRFGGTSAGSPQWAGLVALADQAAHRRLGLINDDLYKIARSPRAYAMSFHDIVQGTNNFAGIQGFTAKPGWDAVTGLGTPKADVLVWALAHGH